jgi:hypothetical protein
VLGALSALLGPALAIRAGFFALTWLQFSLVSRAGRELSGRWAVGVSLGCLVIWTTYPLTNLYHRAALPELFATGFLTCALAAGVIWQLGESRAARNRYLGLAALCLVLAAGMHPITGFLGVPATVAAFGLLRSRFPDRAIRGEARYFLLVAIVAALVLLPWVFAVLAFLPRLNVPGNLIYYERFDRILWRLFPIPFDPGVSESGLSVESPYLEAQINFALAWLVAGLALWHRGAGGERAPAVGTRSFWGALALVALILALSSWPIGPGFARAIGVHKAIGIAQLAYRYTTYLNYFLLVAAFAVLDRAEGSGKLSSILVPPLVLAAIGLGIKLDHARQTQRGINPLPWDDEASLLHLPPTFYGIDDYAITRGENHWEPSGDRKKLGLEFTVSRDRFGEVGDAAVPPGLSGSWLLTNVAPFPWTGIRIDGGLLPPERLAIGHAEHRIDESRLGEAGRFRAQSSACRAIRLPPSARRATLEWQPPALWLVARAVAFPLLLLWCLAVAGMFLAAFPIRPMVLDSDRPSRSPKS